MHLGYLGVSLDRHHLVVQVLEASLDEKLDPREFLGVTTHVPLAQPQASCFMLELARLH